MKKILLAAGMMASIALSSVSAFAEEKVTVYTAVHRFSSMNLCQCLKSRPELMLKSSKLVQVNC